MIEVVPFKAEHLGAIVPQSIQVGLDGLVSSEALRMIEVSGWAWSGIADGHLIGSAGIQKIWHGRALCWAFLAQDVGREMLHVVRAMLGQIGRQRFRRLEMAVRCDFEPGHRMARLLGFHMEAERLSAYLPNGQDAALYARILHDA